MKILELLLPKSLKDRDLSPKETKEISLLQKRMEQYADKIMDPATSSAGKEFLRDKLKSDYDNLRTALKLQETPEEAPATKWEVYDGQTGMVMKNRGPYNTRSGAQLAADRLDNKYGAYRYRVRPVGDKRLAEAVTKLPLTNADFDLVKTVMQRPIPAVIASIYISDIINDDELNDMIASLEGTEPDRDIRPLIVDWFRRVMPDQMHRFGQEVAGEQQRQGVLSVVHGYDPKMYKGGTDTGTESSGNAYGYR